MFGCGEDTGLPDDDEALAAPPQGEAFGLVPRICYSLLRRLEDANTGEDLLRLWSTNLLRGGWGALLLGRRRSAAAHERSILHLTVNFVVFGVRIPSWTKREISIRE